MKNTIFFSILIALVGFALLYKLGDIPLADPDEPRYAESAREMIEKGSYMVPYFNYEPRLQKPVLHYLLICASYKLFGISEFSARLPSAFAALGMVVITFFFLRRFYGLAAATVSCLIMASSPLFFVPGRLSMPDMVFSCLMIASLFCFYLGWDTPESGAKKRWYAGFYVLQVIAAWTKGPVGILIPVAVAVLSLWREKDLRELRYLRLGRNLIIVLLASLPWYLYIYLFVDRSTMATLSQRETVGRIFGWFGRSHDPLYYYLGVVMAGMIPWTFLMPWALYRRFRSLETGRLLRFLEVCFLFVFVFFTICATKKAQYVILLVCVIASWLGTIVSIMVRGPSDRRDAGFAASFFVFFAVAIVGAFKGLSWLSKNQPELVVGGIAALITLTVPALAAVWLAARGHGRSALVSLSLVMLLTLVPAVSSLSIWVETQRSMKAFLLENESVIARAERLYSGVKTFNSLPFYLRRQVAVNTDEESLAELLQGPTPIIVFTEDRKFEKYRHLLEPYFTAAKYRKVLLSNFAAKGEAP